MLQDSVTGVFAFCDSLQSPTTFVNALKAVTDVPDTCVCHYSTCRPLYLIVGSLPLVSPWGFKHPCGLNADLHLRDVSANKRQTPRKPVILSVMSGTNHKR